jgi:5-carboxymethyl-2-hydroxymuconic-semialdehyde dehydrogenase
MTTITVEGVHVDTRHWIGGQRVASTATFTDISPIDETVLGEISAGGANEVDAAVAAARAAFPAWAAMAPADRAAILRRVADGSTRGPRTWRRSRPGITGRCCDRIGEA